MAYIYASTSYDTMPRALFACVADWFTAGGRNSRADSLEWLKYKDIFDVLESIQADGWGAPVQSEGEPIEPSEDDWLDAIEDVRESIVDDDGRVY